MLPDENMHHISQADQEFVWHAFGPLPHEAWIVEKGDGCYITDASGKTYLDAMSGLWCVNVGYGQERIARRVYDQLCQLPYYPLSAAHAPAALLAEKLNTWLGGNYRIFYANSGSEANETAFKMARQYHAMLGQVSRYKIISRYRAYHGNTLGALSATGQHQRKTGYEPLAPGFLHIHPPDPYRESHGRSEEEYARACAEDLEKAILWEGPETIAAFILEPIITGGGMLVPPAHYMNLIAGICKKYGVLVIVDEVITGFGRTGKHFAFQHDDIEPDFVTMAKGITSGYLPLSATAVRMEIYEEFRKQEAQDATARFRHVNTFGGHPASCAAALENLAIYDEGQLVERVAEMGKYMIETLNTLRDFTIVGDVRGRGLLAGIELVQDRVTKQPFDNQKVGEIISHCKQLGVILSKNGDTVAGLNNVITVCPPFIVSREEILRIRDTLASAIALFC